jgi:hypothetical protein
VEDTTLDTTKLEISHDKTADEVEKPDAEAKI